MGSLRLLFFILHIILDLVAPTTAQINDAVCTFTADFCWRCQRRCHAGQLSYLYQSVQSLLFQNCSYQKEAILWAKPCMVRYSSKLIFGVEEDEPINRFGSKSSTYKRKEGELSKITIISIIVAVIAFILTLLVSICIFFRVRKRPVKLKLENDNSGWTRWIWSCLQGRLANGQYIAVKRLSKNSEQGDREFKMSLNHFIFIQSITGI
ncbi:hypothetical protein M0R45_013006 [Rubus argutus]|uniref:Uncharacterized protein n=1 Tax=Rubus argutus TaxID=59490 RepID=A0AAW1XHG6_RUBAR